jgi:monoamine oxidase
MRERRVLVCGAGLSGLTAAHELARARADVTILEARGRAGGRVWTVRDGFADGQHGELGGEFIDADHKHLHALAERFHLQLVPVLKSGFTHRFRSAEGGIDVSRTRPWETIREVLAPLIQRYNAAGRNPDSDAVRAIAACSLDDWFRKQRVDDAVYAMAHAVRGLFLAEADQLSALQVVEQLADGDLPSQTRMSRIAGGGDRLVAALVRETRARLLLAHEVRRIVHTPERVVAQVTDAAGAFHEIEGDSAVITLPAAVLRNIDICPPLPADQRRAIGAVKYGCATKVVVQTASRALRDRRAQAFATDTPLGAFWDATEGQPSEASAVISFLAGAKASAQLQHRLGEGADRLLNDLCWLGLAGAPVIASDSTTWEHDPFAGGGYAFSDPAFDPSWRSLLSRRAGRLVFAGEHTSNDFQGYMEGAVQSGMRAAGEILHLTP